MDTQKGGSPHIPKRVLVVEGELARATALAETVASLRFAVEMVATTAEEALEKANAEHPDIVLMDVFLHRQSDGIEAAMELARRFDIPVVFVANNTDPSTLDCALAAHPYGYIAAPYNANTLLATLQLALQRHADEVELRREHAEKEAWLERRNESLGELAGKLLEESIHDDLTGLYNRRHLDRVMVRELSLARREGRSLGIILLDLDRFKLLNDTFGHSAGDAALRAVADFLRSRLRAHDVVCRYGGEEIVVVLSGARASEASQLAEQLRAGIEQLRIEHEGKPLSTLTASFGVSSYPENGSDPAALLQAADAALYLSKEQGRNRVSRAPAACPR